MLLKHIVLKMTIMTVTLLSVVLSRRSWYRLVTSCHVCCSSRSCESMSTTPVELAPATSNKLSHHHSTLILCRLSFWRQLTKFIISNQFLLTTSVPKHLWLCRVALWITITSEVTVYWQMMIIILIIIFTTWGLKNKKNEKNNNEIQDLHIAFKSHNTQALCLCNHAQSVSITFISSICARVLGK